METKFHVGDRIVLHESSRFLERGEVGTVVGKLSETFVYVVIDGDEAEWGVSTSFLRKRRDHVPASR